MLRVFLGAAGGYIVMVLVIMLGLSLGYGVLGAERAFHPGGTQVTPLWMGLAVLINVLAAAAGGRVAYSIGHRNEAVLVLAAAVLLLGLYTAWPDAGAPATTTVDPHLMSIFEAARHAVHPDWFNWIMPVVSAAFIWYAGIGARR